jgi:hypothetical protein
LIGPCPPKISLQSYNSVGHGFFTGRGIWPNDPATPVQWRRTAQRNQSGSPTLAAAR